ncbi:hypothetical protein DKG77_13325 [Flagellimonas aquimarina]|uniref:Uncharacterized protein n=1 Tax=Flagellimonas aquimarina TaxID=2201895 RepID=A0A316LCF3_9FLAO|nr:DJ-1/PfpI family protein [Allomuricauda koreensis]PWL37750.1 hypothetical protein DKG77_13325 [Allomuricauda koreensis]
MNKLIIPFLLLCGIAFSYPQNSTQTPDIYICPPCGLECDNTEHTNPGICSFCNMTLMKKENVKTIAFYLQERVEVLDFAGPMEVLSYAGFNVFTVSAKKDPIKSQGILSVIPDYTIEDAPEADILAFFGGNASPTSKNPKVMEWIKKQEQVKYHFSVCTGAFILAEAGILDGKTATTFHSSLDNLKNNYPKINVRKNVRFVDNGRVITTAGISAGIDGALHLVAKLHGLNAAKRIAYNMEYDNWQLGNGLILSEDNPYENRISNSDLAPFEGLYEYKDGGQITLKINKKDGDLYTIVDELVYPLYHEKDDTFSNIADIKILFKRNASDQIVGYSLDNDAKVYKKL